MVSLNRHLNLIILRKVSNPSGREHLNVPAVKDNSGVLWFLIILIISDYLKH